MADPRIDWEIYKLDDNKRKLLEDNYGLIQYIARRWERKLRGMYEYDDLVQIGSIGFIKSLKTYSEDKGKISNYAGYGIEAEILKEVNKNDYVKNEVATDFININSSNYSIEDNILNNCVLDQIIDDLHNSPSINKDSIKIFKQYLFDDINQSDVARKMNVSRQAINQRLQIISQKVKDKYGYDLYDLIA